MMAGSYRLGDIRWSRFLFPIFVKPIREKLFTGLVLESAADVDKIQIGISGVEDLDSEQVIVAPYKHILSEARFFIVGGKITTGSFYRRYGRPERINADTVEGVEERQFVSYLIESFGCPDDGFVIDVAKIYHDRTVEFKIVELNNLNSAGIYQSNVDSLTTHLLYYDKRSV